MANLQSGREKWFESRQGARYLDLAGEVEGKVLVDDAVRGGEEGEHVADEVPLVVAQVLPVLLVVGQVELLGGPEAGLRLLVLVPDLKAMKMEPSVRSWRTESCDAAAGEAESGNGRLTSWCWMGKIT
jgi:hypothetical protein